ncbi:MAG: sulfurtransferase TusA family protein [Paracoccaceae bacterium]|jgi:tRNA 2-thiouridine synthesizing protein A
MPQTLDTKGLLCPLPVLKLRKALQTLRAGDQIVMEADDPAAQIDVPHFCNEAGHRLVTQKNENGILEFTVEKAAL